MKKYCDVCGKDYNRPYEFINCDYCRRVRMKIDDEKYFLIYLLIAITPALLIIGALITAVYFLIF